MRVLNFTQLKKLVSVKIVFQIISNTDNYSNYLLSMESWTKAKKKTPLN